jgi:RNA polymerase sigma factor (TIGR02999 family)
MSEVTRILDLIQQGDTHAAEELLPLVYDELRMLAAKRISQEPPGQTLQPTALVHEAYLRLVDVTRAQHWNSRGHFFAAAAEAMRRILVDAARAKHAEKRGGQRKRLAVDIAKIKCPEPNEDLLALNEAIDHLASRDDAAAQLVKLRFFAGLTAEQAATTLAISPRSADRLWNYARAFLLKVLSDPAAEA